MALSPAFPGLFFCFTAMVLLIFISVSYPVWDKVVFLKATIGGNEYKFGLWGYTGLAGKHLGYTVDPSKLGLTDSSLNSSVLKNLTYIMVLHPIAAGFSFLAVIFGLCGTFSYNRIGTILMSVLATLSLLITIIAFASDMILWGIYRNRIRNDGGKADYGNANWLAAGAVAALVLGTCASGCGSFGRYRHKRHDDSY